MQELCIKRTCNLDFLNDSWFSETFHPNLVYNDDDIWDVVEVDGEVVGLGFVRGWHDNWPEKVLGIVVKKEWRHKGIGKLILLVLEVESRLRGLKSIRLHCRDDNIDASMIYVHEGYFTEDRREDGEYIMRKEL
jgi:ribosomal protein S18 acetylase RimI-like enzyme